MNDRPATEDFDMVEISTIIIKDRSRDLDQDWAEALAGLFRNGEMANPITLWRGPDGPQLVAGLHRITAQKINGETWIAAKWSKAKSFAEAKLLEVMENVARRELGALDRARHLFDMKEAYEALYPQAKKGGDKQTEGARKELSEIISFSSDAAEKVGLSPRAIQMAVAMWKGLSNQSKDTINGTWLADHQAGLIALSKQKAKMQAKALALIFPGEGKPPKAANVADALYILENGRLLSSVEKRFDGLNKALGGLAEEELDAVLVANEDRIMAWVERRIGGAN